MSIYAQAVVSGISALSGHEADAAYDQAYNQVYANEAKRASICNAMHSAQLNLSAVEQDKVLTNSAIRMQQNQAEAAATVAAATAGVEGGSVDDILYETKRNEAMAINNANRKAEQQSANLIANIGSQMGSLLAVQDNLPQISAVDDLLGAMSSFQMSDLEIGEAMSSYFSNDKQGDSYELTGSPVPISSDGTVGNPFEMYS